MYFIDTFWKTANVIRKSLTYFLPLMFISINTMQSLLIEGKCHILAACNTHSQPVLSNYKSFTDK